jgi:hypothetical protein
MNYGELQKLYPDFKIPYEKEAPYYIELLLKNDSSLQQKYNDFFALEMAEGDPIRYKFKKFDEIIAYFKTMNWDLNSIPFDHPILNPGYATKEFSNYKPDKFYVSVDLKEANWESFKFGLGIEDKSDFEKWSIKTFDLHHAIARSKSFRQFLFGNTNPKRLQRIQESMMKEIITIFNDDTRIVGKKSDELVFEFDNENYNLVQAMRIIHQIKITHFTVSEHTNLNEFVRVKTIFLPTQEKKLMAVPGNRFFLHYKTLILNEGLDERDTYFINERNLAKWVL